MPFATKRALIDTVIESIIEYDTSLLTYEPMNKHLNFSLTCVVIYTNLTYEDEEGLDAYDALLSSNLFFISPPISFLAHFLRPTIFPPFLKTGSPSGA